MVNSVSASKEKKEEEEEEDEERRRRRKKIKRSREDEDEKEGEREEKREEMILLKNVSNQKNPPDEMSHHDPKKSLSDELIVRKFRILPELSDIYMPHSMERGKLLVCGRSFCAIKFSAKLVGTQWQLGDDDDACVCVCTGTASWWTRGSMCFKT